MQRHSEFFATCPPGLGRLLRDGLAAVTGVDITGSGRDGESDVVLFGADRAGRLRAAGLRLADGVFAVAAGARRDGSTDPAAVAARCWPPDGVQRALSLWAEQVRPLSPALTYRITVRMRTGPRALRSGLRPAFASAVRRDRPRWRPSARGELEILLSEWRDGDLLTGLRLGGNRDGAVAAAMVALAGPPTGVLLDPGQRTGAVVAEARAAGWTAEAAADGARAAEIAEDDAALGACVTQLPPDTGPGELAAALAEMSRVTRSGGTVVVLAPAVAVWPPALRLRRQLPVGLPGGRETIWVFRRA
jgi:hypothetical protein